MSFKLASGQKSKIDTIGSVPAKFPEVTHILKSGCIYWRLADLLEMDSGKFHVSECDIVKRNNGNKNNKKISPVLGSSRLLVNSR